MTDTLASNPYAPLRWLWGEGAAIAAELWSLHTPPNPPLVPKGAAGGRLGFGAVSDLRGLSWPRGFWVLPGPRQGGRGVAVGATL